MRPRVALLAIVLVSVGCFSRPDIRYYELAVDQSMLHKATKKPDVVLSVESMVGDSAYEDPRMVYRTSPYHLDYYFYHRWTSPPGVLVSDFLREAYEDTGYFSMVVSGFSPDAPVFLSGRIVQFEEVDVDKKDWKARVKLNLYLRDAKSGNIVWSRTLSREQPVTELKPEGVARAMSTALSDIVTETAPEFAQIAKQLSDRQKREKRREKVLQNLSPEPSEPSEAPEP